MLQLFKLYLYIYLFIFANTLMSALFFSFVQGRPTVASMFFMQQKIA